MMCFKLMKLIVERHIAALDRTKLFSADVDLVAMLFKQGHSFGF